MARKKRFEGRITAHVDDTVTAATEVITEHIGESEGRITGAITDLRHAFDDTAVNAVEVISETIGGAEDRINRHTTNAVEAANRTTTMGRVIGVILALVFGAAGAFASMVICKMQAVDAAGNAIAGKMVYNMAPDHIAVYAVVAILCAVVGYLIGTCVRGRH